MVFAASDRRHYLPQVQLQSHTSLTPVSFTTQLKQTFRNPNQTGSLDQVRYTFPLYDGVAVSGYTISYADKHITGVVKQKDDARQTYQAAVDRGETAGLLESLPAGVFGVTLGNVPAQTDIVVDIQYCGELKHDAGIDGLRYTLPTSIAPRYGNYPGEVARSNADARGGIKITIDADMAKLAIRKVQSPSHPIAVSMGSLSTEGDDSSFVPSKASATLTLGSAELAQDFILQLVVENIAQPQAILESHPSLPHQRAIMTTLVPKFALPTAYPEIVFVADQSGSMGGSKNTALVSALKVFLKSLPFGVRFNIVAFGSSFQSLWPQSQAYNEQNVTVALNFADGFHAHFGGTEILQPIRSVFENRLNDMPLEVMLLTDGEVWDEHNVFQYINSQIRGSKDHASVDARVFALGIGGDASHSLVEGVARAGNGFAQFVTADEDTDQKVVRMLKGALYARTKDYSLEVHYADEETAEDDFELVELVSDSLKIDDKPPAYDAEPKATPKSFFDESVDLNKPAEPKGRYAHLPAIDSPKLLQAPTDLPPLFPFNRTTAYVLLGPDTPQKPVSSITLRAMSAEGPLTLTVPVYDSGRGRTVHQLAARKAIQDLEEGRGWLMNATSGATPLKVKYPSRFDEIVEREAVRIGVQFQVAGKWTSFVAVENGKEAVEEDATAGEKVQQREEGSSRRMRRQQAAAPAGGFATISHSMAVAPSGARKLPFGAQPPPPAPSADRRRVSPLSGATRAAFGLSARGGKSSSMGAVAEGGLFGASRPVAAAASYAPQSYNVPPAAKKSRSVWAARKSAPGPPVSPGYAPHDADEEMVDELAVSTAQSMHRLIALQSFSGAWAMSPELENLVRVTSQTVSDLKAFIKQNGVGEDASSIGLICATALALAWLKKQCREKEEAWEMVGDKAKNYLVGVLGEGTFENVLAKAVEMV